MLTNQSPPEAKIQLFRSLFKGREDVFAQRFESRKTGRSGYSPACANEWARGLCGKPAVKCAKCPNRHFLKVSAETTRWHLTGRDRSGHPFVMGLYPMLIDETVHFLAMDLDGEGWQEDARVLVDVCRDLDLPVCLERSRSGNGGHLWFFFAEALPAVTARKFGSALLTAAMNTRPDIGFRSYDRLFPNQDTLPTGRFGNLIALPLQREARQKGNSAFVDINFTPHCDQWAFLSALPRLSPSRIVGIISRQERLEGIIGVRLVPEEDDFKQPWKLTPSRNPHQSVKGPLPDAVHAVLSDQVYIPKNDLTPSLRNHLSRLAAFQNPEFYRAQAMRLPTYDKPRIIACAEEFPDHIALPRGCLEDTKAFCRQHGITFRVKNKCFKGVPLDLRFTGVLREDQEQAKDSLLKKDTGVVAATTAFGKTVLAAAMIAERGVNTLILVHRQQLMEQWIERLTTFLTLDRKDIGCLGAGRRKLKGKVDIALLQSIVRKSVVDDRIAEYGHIIVDECHHISARNFELAVRRAKAKYILGLSATVTRKDGHHPIIFMQCGPVRYQVEAAQHAETSQLTRQVIVRPTSFIRHQTAEEEDSRTSFPRLMGTLVRDTRRNALIRDDIVAALNGGAHPLVLTERTEHLDILSALLGETGVEPICIKGGMSKKALSLAFERIAETSESGHPQVILATGRFVGEGFDLPELDTLFLTLPMSWKGTVAQYVGRLHRTVQGKDTVRVFDYADLNVAMLEKMFTRRCQTYRRQGYALMVPASAIPGWPTDVPLPIDEKWKETYSASVQRLVRDGVDTPLAELFVNVATPPAALNEKEGIDRARSASEAFLFRRLESLPETRGRFTLNARLDIPFRGQRGMEVDFLDSDNHLAIEIDGARHFHDRDTYRRDREKDFLLQERGFRVLRFLAEDLGSHLNHILDTILRAGLITP
ncbi:MAG: DEAD/DEAH box helicase family protein [Lentisphaeria bacterium]|nr:DEAD/DEAH box helicase family protein [Lentisphaeria bacterium]